MFTFCWQCIVCPDSCHTQRLLDSLVLQVNKFMWKIKYITIDDFFSIHEHKQTLDLYLVSIDKGEKLEQDHKKNVLLNKNINKCNSVLWKKYIHPWLRKLVLPSLAEILLCKHLYNCLWDQHFWSLLHKNSFICKMFVGFFAWSGLIYLNWW